VVIDQLTQHPGNISRLIDQLRSPAQPPAGWSQASDVLSHALGSGIPWITGTEPVEPFSDRVLGSPWWTVVPFVVAFVAAAVYAWRRGRTSEYTIERRAVRDALALQALLVGVLIVGTLSLLRVAGDTYPYLVRWMWVVAAFGWLSIGWTTWVTRRATRAP